MTSESKSRESELLDPVDDTLDDVENEYDQVLKSPKTKKIRGKAILYELHSTFDDFQEIKKRVEDGLVKGNTMVFKKQADNKYRYYCQYLSQGCKAALYIQLNEGTKGFCFVSDAEHTDHPENIYVKISIW